MSCDCDNLESYLAAELAGEDAAKFASHLPCCDECREAVDEQRWIDGLLREGANEDSELPPDDALVKLRVSIDRHRARRKQFAFAVAAAAALLVAVSWTALSRRAAEVVGGNQIQPAVAADSQPTNLQATSSQTTQPRTTEATFVSNSGAIAVPVKSRHANVTIVRVYPTLQPSYENQTAAFQPEAPVDQDWNNYSTGG